MAIKNFRDLLVWQSGMRLVESLYAATESFHEGLGIREKADAQSTVFSPPPNP